MTHNIFRRRVLFMGLIIFISFLNGAHASQDGVPERGLQIAPAKLILDFKPGEVKEVVVNVKNYDKNLTHEVIIGIEDFYVTDGSAKAQFFVPDAEHELVAYDVIDWIEVEKGFELKPGESKDVKMRISVPKDTPTGGYYGVVFFKTSESKNEAIEGKQVSVDVNYRVGMLLINAVRGDAPIVIDGSVEDFSVTKKIFWQSPVTVFAKLRSEGNIHYKASGQIEIKKFGKRNRIIMIEPEVMFPNRSKTFTKKTEFGTWDFGRYTANLTMWSEDKSVNFEDQVEFYVIPKKGLIIIGEGLALLLVLIVVFKKYIHIEVGSRKKRKTR